MRKSTLFISAVLTTFVMAMLAGVASAYQNAVDTDPIAAMLPQSEPQQPQTKAISNVVPAPIPTEILPVNWTPEEAAALAAEVLGHDDLYSVEIADLNGETVYMVTFTSGDLVYVSLDGQIRSIGKVQVETVIVNSGGGGGGGGNNNRSGNSSSSSNSSGSSKSHEGHDDDHEEHEDHDD